VRRGASCSPPTPQFSSTPRQIPRSNTAAKRRLSMRKSQTIDEAPLKWGVGADSRPPLRGLHKWAVRRKTVLKIFRQAGGRAAHSSGANLNLEHELMPESPFRRALQLEEKRAERSRRRFVLMLLDADALLNSGTTRESAYSALQALVGAIRETDIKG